MFKDGRLIKETYSGYGQILSIFEEYMNYIFPWSLIRPNYIYRPKNDFYPETIQRRLKALSKLYLRIVGFVESNKKIVSLEKIDIPSKEEMKTLNITGPFARATGLLPYDTESSDIINQSSTKHLQFAFNNETNIMSVLRTSYSEIYLSINKSLKLIPAMTVDKTNDIEIDISGETNFTMTYPLGQAHLTINLKDNKVNYFNFVPVQQSNLYGFQKLVSQVKHPFSSLIKLFYFPEFLVFSKLGVVL